MPRGRCKQPNVAISMLFLIVLCVNLERVGATLGVDMSVATTADTFSCLSAQGIAFVIPRVYRCIGETDPLGLKSMQLALQQKSFKFVDGYIFPCVPDAPYNVQNNITCPTPAQQVQDTLNMLSALPPLEQKLRLWLDVEDELPSKYYSIIPDSNIKLLSEMTKALEANGVSVGVYTTKTYWAQIMGNALNWGSQYPLWSPRYDATNSMTFFEPFADFTSVFIKQTGGGTALCGITVDTDYML